jgi:hypothetical protein
MHAVPFPHRVGVAALLAAASLSFPATGRAAPSFAAQTLTEGSTGVRFQSELTVGETPYRCLGVSARKFFTFAIYAVAFCMEASQADLAVNGYVRVAHPGRDGAALVHVLASDQQFFETLSDAPGEKLIELYFLRDVPRERLARSLRKDLGKYLPRADAERVAASVSDDVKKDSIALLHTRGASLVLELGGRARLFENEPALASGLFRVWLGRESVTPGIKASIAKNVVAAPRPLP